MVITNAKEAEIKSNYRNIKNMINISILDVLSCIKYYINN